MSEPYMDVNDAHNYDGNTYHRTDTNNSRAEVHLSESKTWVAALVVGAAIAVNLGATVFLYMKWRDAEMENRLKEYNLDWFKTHEFTELNTKVSVLEQTKCTR